MVWHFNVLNQLKVAILMRETSSVNAQKWKAPIPRKCAYFSLRTLTCFRVAIKKFSLYRIKIFLFKSFEILLISNLTFSTKEYSFISL